MGVGVGVGVGRSASGRTGGSSTQMSRRGSWGLPGGVVAGVRRSGRHDRAGGATAAATAAATAGDLVVGDLLHHRDGFLPGGLDLVGVLLGLLLAGVGPGVVELHLPHVDLEVAHLVGLAGPVTLGLRLVLRLVALVAVHLGDRRLGLARDGHRVAQRLVDLLDVVGTLVDLLADRLERLERALDGLLAEVLADRGGDRDQRRADVVEAVAGVLPLVELGVDRRVELGAGDQVAQPLLLVTRHRAHPRGATQRRGGRSR